MHNAFNSDYYEVNRAKHPKRRNYNKAKTAIRLIKTATFAKTAINRCITRKCPKSDNPNLLIVNEFADLGHCKERSDGIAIVTLCVNRVQS